MHTPGPWTVATGKDERDFVVLEPSGNTVCEPNIEAFYSPADFDPNVRRIPVAEATANAHLIAAAPDLLSVARLIAGSIECCECCSSHPHRGDCQLMAVIAKAEGRS